MQCFRANPPPDRVDRHRRRLVDDTAGVIARCLARLQRTMRVEFHRHPNRGLGPTLARAVTLARGDYVQFLASDDAVFPQ